MTSIRTQKCYWGPIDNPPIIKYIKVDDAKRILQTNVVDPLDPRWWIPVSETDRGTYEKRSGSCFDWPETNGGGGTGKRRLLKTGPRGGKYYIKRGKKVYV